MIRKNIDQNLTKWRKLQEIGEAKAKKLGLGSEKKIIENLEILKPKDFIEKL